MLDGLVWFFSNIGQAFVNAAYAITHPSSWLSWIGGLETTEDKQALMRFVYYGGSVEFFFVVFTLFLIVTAVGFWRNGFMWGCVRVLEGLANSVGRFFAWAGLLMVLQQIVIVFMQRIFTVAEISLIWKADWLTADVSWWAEELKLYNAMIVCLCATYTFVQGGHVRVDLVYSTISHRAKRVIDMLGSLIFMMPAAVLTWMYGWFFMWRHLVTPKVSASDKLTLLEKKARILKWNVETIGFSPNGFNAYFLFKVLLVLFAGMVFLQAIAFFYRSFLEFKEGAGSAGKYLDRDTLGEGEEAYEGTH
ncbi:TRAP transporter small permease subunit [Shimia sp. R9_2]|uniref:TRAP transporter small permease subunit n=1 Tax=unclassified Shimia TaxID=2630038 RepID=UPI001ADC9EF9|nr:MULTISPECIES: TRAP transporter small permease subunit [unclassified Shimia]MBO9397407.1 TRAP transporter small permease subunit [Shimia sp. R9_2]MBO9402030.1 TRAP transporter small permease subunit [Shimia sp. R9_3]